MTDAQVVPVPLDKQEFFNDELVAKRNGDYTFFGVIRAAFQKRSGRWRYVVENDDGLLHVFSGSQLERARIEETF